MTAKFRGIMEQLGQLSVKMQFVGLDQDNNYEKGNKISNEHVLEIVS